MAALTLDLRPGSGLGSFTLGMPVCEALAHVEQHRSVFDVVHIKYNDEEPLRFDLVVSFPEHGFHLRFEPRSQRLRVIEVFDVQRLQMRYATSSIGGPSIAATFVGVYALFGPTFPGTYDTKRCTYTLFYPGLSFAFPIPAQYKECCQQREAELPLEFPDGTTPVMSRVCIYDSSVGENVGVGDLLKKAVLPQLASGSSYMEEVHAKLAEELSFTGGRKLPFGASPQDVWGLLGRPDSIHQKQPLGSKTVIDHKLKFPPKDAGPAVDVVRDVRYEGQACGNEGECAQEEHCRSTYKFSQTWKVDPMVIHSSSDPRPRTALCGDYFYNYFSRGVDILFDGQNHRIKKFVLHTNFPGHTDFNCYIKCNFFIHCLTGETEESSHVGANGDAPPPVITAFTKFSEVQEILGEGGRAAIQTQGSVSNPFGPTFVYGYRNIALECPFGLVNGEKKVRKIAFHQVREQLPDSEVMKNGHLATVTLFQTNPS